jgi:hypothetical protein
MPFAFIFLCPFKERSVPERAMDRDREIGISIAIFRQEITFDE